MLDFKWRCIYGNSSTALGKFPHLIFLEVHGFSALLLLLPMHPSIIYLALSPECTPQICPYWSDACMCTASTLHTSLIYIIHYTSVICDFGNPHNSVTFIEKAISHISVQDDPHMRTDSPAFTCKIPLLTCSILHQTSEEWDMVIHSWKYLLLM